MGVGGWMGGRAGREGLGSAPASYCGLGAYYQADAGACADCPAGTFSSAAATAPADCLPCAAGT